MGTARRGGGPPRWSVGRTTLTLNDYRRASRALRVQRRELRIGLLHSSQISFFLSIGEVPCRRPLVVAVCQQHSNIKMHLFSSKRRSSFRLDSEMRGDDARCAVCARSPRSSPPRSFARSLRGPMHRRRGAMQRARGAATSQCLECDGITHARRVPYSEQTNSRIRYVSRRRPHDRLRGLERDLRLLVFFPSLASSLSFSLPARSCCFSLLYLSLFLPAKTPSNTSRGASLLQRGRHLFYLTFP